jgi:Raf kinase inhibitor-like YbhB/YbcL family protein
MKLVTSILRIGAALVASIVFNVASAADFKLTSPELRHMQAIEPAHYWNNFGCSGDNMAPKLEWANPPAGTKSFAVTFYDQDAPTGSGFWHWVAYDIPANVTALEGGKDGGTLPAGAVQSNTDLSKPGFFGPCPPVGRKHRYEWTVHALKVDKLPVKPSMSPALVGFFIGQNRIGQAQLTVVAGPRK